MRDLVQLGKPGIMVFVAMTAAGGFGLGQVYAPASTQSSFWLLVLGTALIVAGANALNMVIERDIDKHMARTQRRPLPAGRMHASTATVFGVVLSVAAIPVLLIGTNVLTAFLAALANLLYVFAYTPLKQRSHHSLLVGAVPGAIPPLLGWTAATGQLDATGLCLFSILFLWQVPHSLAIGLFRKEDYARAGLVVMANVRTEMQVKHSIASYSLALVLVSLLLVPLGAGGGLYLAGAALFGLAFLAIALLGFAAPENDPRWARSLFFASLLYQMALIGVLITDVVA